MKNKLLGKNVKIGIALMSKHRINPVLVTEFYEGIVTDYVDEFIELDNKTYIAKKYVQTIEII